MSTRQKRDQSKVRIRYCVDEDIKHFLEMARKLNWDNTEFDCNATLSLDPTSFLVAVDEADIPLGFIIAVKLSENTAYINGFIVREDVTGNGIGKQLFKRALETTTYYNTCLDSVSNLVGWYGKYGFVHKSITATHYVGFASKESIGRQVEDSNFEMHPLTEKQVLKYDMFVHQGVSREKMLRLWFLNESAYTIVALMNGNICGYGCAVRRSDREYNVRTVICDNGEIASQIICRIASTFADGMTLRFSLLDDKVIPYHVSNFKAVYKIHRLFTKFSYEVDVEKIFCINCQFI